MLPCGVNWYAIGMQGRQLVDPIILLLRHYSYEHCQEHMVITLHHAVGLWAVHYRIHISNAE